MTLAHPTALWFLLLAAPLVAIFLYRRRRPVVVVAALTVWSQLGRAVQPRSFRTNLRRILSLAVQLLILLMLAVALAEPRHERRPTRRAVIVVDVSATMRTVEPSGPRIDLARRMADAVVGALAADAEVVLVEAGASPRLVCPPTADRQAIASALRDIAAIEVDGDLPAAVRIAGGYIESGRAGVLTVISDFAGCDPAVLRDTWPGDGTLQLLAVGTPQADVAVTAVDVRADGEPRVRATLRQIACAGREVAVHLRADGRHVDTRRVRLEDEATVVEFPVTLPAGTAFEVAIDAGDALAADDRAWGVVGASSQLRVCLVTRGNPPLEAALRAAEGSDVVVASPGSFTDAAGASVVVLDGCQVPASGLAGVKGLLLVNAADPLGALALDPPGAGAAVSSWADAHPAMAGVEPSEFRVDRLARIGPASTAAISPLLMCQALPAIVEVERPGGRGPRCIAWLFDLRDTDLPRRIGFPILVLSTIDYLSGRDGAEAPGELRTGQPLVVNAVEGTAPLVRSPDGRLVELRRTGAAWRSAPVTMQGIYRVEPDGPRLAVSLLSDRGTRPLPEQHLFDAPPAPGGDGGAGVVPRSLDWRALLATLAALSLAEWFLYCRGVIRLG